MRYYTGTGDTGETHGLNGRCAKSDPQIEAFGALDEAQVALGFAVTEARKQAELEKMEESVQLQDIITTLNWMQRVLFTIGGIGDTSSSDFKKLTAKIEVLCDRFTPQEPQNSFTIPGTTELSARIELARVALRRYERRLCTISEGNEGMLDALPLVNRLSDLAYALARHCD